MKLSELKTATKPFIKTPRLEVSATHLKKKILHFTVKIDWEEKKFVVKNHNYLATLKSVIKYIESKL